MTETAPELVARLRNPPFGTETSERNLMSAAADWITAALAREAELRKAGNWLSVCAQSTGGTAGRDEGLVEAIAGWSAAAIAIYIVSDPE